MRLIQCTIKRRDSRAQAASKVEVTNNVATVVVTRISVGIIVQLIPQKCPAYGKECFLYNKKGHFKQYCCSTSQNHSQSHSGGGRKSRKDMHDIDQDEEVFQMQDYDSVNVQTVCFTTDVCHTVHTNIVFDEISSDRKLQCLLTDVKISNESGLSSTVRIKLDTGACGNPLPFNIYKNIHPQVSVKDLCKTIDKRVCLEAYNKSEIKQVLVHVA